MRILHLIDSGGLYGAEVMLLNLVGEQIAQGHEPTILSAGSPDSGDKPIELAARQRGIPVVAWRMRPGLNLWTAWKILNFARAHGFEVLHSHGYKFNILLGLFPRRLRQLPVVTTVHGYTSVKRASTIRIYELLDKRILRRLDRVVLVSPAMRSIPALAAIRPNRLVETPNGIDVDALNPDGPVDQDSDRFLRSHPLTVGIVGRLSPEKGILDALEAVSHFEVSGTPVGLLLVGEGSQRTEIKSRIAQLGLQEHVHLAGYRSPAHSYMKRCAVILMPSYTEGLPITLIEAMALRVPVIASRVGAIPRLLDHGRYGSVVEPGDPAGLRSTLADVLQNRDALTEVLEAARHRIETKYSARSMAESYAQAYATLSAPFSRGRVQPRRIHFLMDSIANPHAGTESQAIKLMSGLRAAGWKVDAAFLRASGYLEDGKLPVPHAVLGIPRISVPLAWWRMLVHACRLRARGIRVVHIFFNDASILAPPLLRLFGIRTIISRRDMGFWYTPSMLRALRVTGLFVDRAVCNSQAVKRITEWSEGIPPDRIVVIYNGHEVAPISGKQSSTNAGPVIGITANIRPIKRIGDLVIAFSIVAQSHPTAELRVVGGGDASVLRRLAAERGVGDKVSFLGPVADASQVLHDWDVAVLCSESEGMSNAIIEYLQAGKPVVCTRTGGNPEIVEDGVNGYLVDVGGVTALAQRITQLLNDPQLARSMGAKGAERARVMFSLRAAIEQYERLYQCLGA